MSTFSYSGSFALAGAGVNGATIHAYKGSRFSSAPALGASPPGGSPDASATTGDTAGFDGAFVVQLPTSEDYYVSVTWLATTYWQGPVYGVFADGTAQGGSSAAGVISPLGGDATSLPLAGGTVTGPIVLPGNPSTALQAVPQQYVAATVLVTSPIFLALNYD